MVSPGWNAEHCHHFPNKLCLLGEDAVRAFLLGNPFIPGQVGDIVGPFPNSTDISSLLLAVQVNSLIGPLLKSQQSTHSMLGPR